MHSRQKHEWHVYCARRSEPHWTRSVTSRWATGTVADLPFSLSLCCRSLPIATFVREISSVSSSCNNRSFAVQLQVRNRHGWMSMYKSLIDKRQRGRKKRICTRHHIGQTDYSDNCNEISIQNSGSVSIHEFHIKLSSVLLTSTFHGIVGPSVSIVAELVALGPFQHDSFKPLFFLSLSFLPRSREIKNTRLNRNFSRFIDFV